MESLIRWQHPDKGLVSPDDFIPFAEETGLIVPLGEWILDTACRQLRLWSKKLAQPLNLAINLSARQFQQADLISTMKRIIDEHGIDPSQIELEITESMVMTNVDKAIEAQLFKAFSDQYTQNRSVICS
jgi:EAL domain-containing protein (putative c-di-GMP-specific phosphodiesterase class I)